MDDNDINLFTKALLGINKKHIDVLEWGAGGSTKYYTDLLHEHGKTFNWLAIEYNKKWFDKISKWDLKKGVELRLFDYGCWHRDEMRQLDINEYVEYPSTINRKWDLIFIDGRKRRRCLIESLKLLKPNGFILLHDAQRDYYKCAYKHFNYKYLSEKLWKGKPYGKSSKPNTKIN